MSDRRLERALTSGEAARLLGLSRTRIGVLVNSGRFRATETPLDRLIDRASIERLAAQRAGQERARTRGCSGGRCAG